MKIQPFEKKKWAHEGCQGNYRLHNELFLYDNRRQYMAETAAVAQWVRALAPQREGRVFESHPRET